MNSLEFIVDFILRMIQDFETACARYREVIQKGLTAPSGAPICCCHNRNAVNAGIEKPCWYCELRAVLASDPFTRRPESDEYEQAFFESITSIRRRQDEE